MIVSLGVIPCVIPCLSHQQVTFRAAELCDDLYLTETGRPISLQKAATCRRCLKLKLQGRAKGMFKVTRNAAVVLSSTN